MLCDVALHEEHASFWVDTGSQILRRRHAGAAS